MTEYPTYPSDAYMFRNLTPEEEREFAEHAATNDPPAGKHWSLFHPACRRVWYARGLRPPDLTRVHGVDK